MIINLVAATFVWGKIFLVWGEQRTNFQVNVLPQYVTPVIVGSRLNSVR